MTDTQIVNAIQARIDGRFDDPDLLLVGALHDRMGDIIEILSMRVELPVSTEERERTAGTPAGLIAARAQADAEFDAEFDAEAKRLIAIDAEQLVPDALLLMPFLLMDDSDDSSHGTFGTLEEAKGAARYDRLKAWTIYSASRIVSQSMAVPDRHPGYDHAYKDGKCQMRGCKATA